jgi:hypothetical protein
MSISVWKRHLGWNIIPSFDEIHKLEENEMIGLYYIQDLQLQGFYNELLADITEPFPCQSIRIEGPPGWGKTSFFYYMAARINHNEECLKYLYIINATSFASFKGIDYDSMKRNCLIAIEAYIENCCSDRSLNSDIGERGDKDDTWKLNFYLEYMAKNKRKFSKSLIMVLDGVDTIPGKYVGELSIELFNLLNSSHIIKWLAIRDIVFQSYPEEIRSCLRTHFPHRREFPRIPLYGIISKRIQSCGNNSNNPFSQMLCYVTQNFCEGDNRIGLAVLKSIMNLADPLDLSPEHPKELPIPKLPLETIQKLFEGSALKIFVSNGIIPNIFKLFANINNKLPLAKEVFSLLACLQLIDERFQKFISVSISEKWTRVSKSYKEVSIKMQDIYDTITFLSNEKLVSIVVDKPLTVSITKKGELTLQFVESAIYINSCKENLEKSDMRKPEVFWQLAYVSSDYEDDVRKQLYGK